MKIRFWKKKEIVKEPKIKNINKCFRFVNNKPEFRLFYYDHWESFDQFISNFFVGGKYWIEYPLMEFKINYKNYKRDLSNFIVTKIPPEYQEVREQLINAVKFVNDNRLKEIKLIEKEKEKLLKQFN